MPLVMVYEPTTDLTEISFRRGGRTSSATLSSRFGLIELSLQQQLGPVEAQHSRIGLQVLAYRYTVTPLGADDPLFRWEFVRFPSSGSFWCRNHLQGPIPIAIGGQSVNLNDWHLPTGWVPIEEVIRFCILDLGVPPLDAGQDTEGNPNWHQRLTESLLRSAQDVHV
jgi:hypothetical protein